ncbi:MAG: hypothetical protein V3V11_02370 [Vicinamibacteria bacterium]
MDEKCRTEIVELHRFFEDWFRARLPQTEANFKRVSEVLEERFEIISPRGDLMTREKLLAVLWEFYGGYRDQQYRIWTEGHRSRSLAEGQLLVTYQEWEEIEGEKKGRLTSAIFRKEEQAANGVKWLHVHEVWIPS